MIGIAAGTAARLRQPAAGRAQPARAATSPSSRVILRPLLFGISAFTDRRRQLVLHRAEDPARRRRRRARRRHLHARQLRPGQGDRARNVAAGNGYTANVDPEPVDRPAEQAARHHHRHGRQHLRPAARRRPPTTITRTSVANYQAPLPMGSPCNGFGNGPEPTIGAINPRSGNCSAAGQYWANVGSPHGTKVSGDAYQDGVCGSGVDGCSGGTNTDYSQRRLLLQRQAQRARHQPDDPGLRRRRSSASATCAAANFGSGDDRRRQREEPVQLRRRHERGDRDVPTRTADLYASGQNAARTAPATCSSAARRRTRPTRSGSRSRRRTRGIRPAIRWSASCVKTYKGFSGDLYTALNEYKQTSGNGAVHRTASPTLAHRLQRRRSRRSSGSGRRCARSPARSRPAPTSSRCRRNAPDDNPPATGTTGSRCAPSARAPTDNSNIAISGYTNMAIYANLTSAQHVVLPDPGRRRPRPARCSTCGCSTSATRPSPAR